MERILSFIVVLFLEVEDNLEDYYRDEEFYEQVYWWCAIIFAVAMILARYIFSNMDE